MTICPMNRELNASVVSRPAPLRSCHLPKRHPGSGNLIMTHLLLAVSILWSSLAVAADLQPAVAAPQTARELGRYDVVVLGAGPSGITAAVAAARMGARTALAERYGAVGGNLTLGNISPVLGSVAPGTMSDELRALLTKGHEEASPAPKHLGRAWHTDPEQAKGRLTQWLSAAGVDLYLQATLCQTVLEGNRMRGAVVATPGGQGILYAACFVDATGDGTAAYLAGAECRVGRDSDGLAQPATLAFTLCDVDESRALAYYGGSDKVTMPDGKLKSYRELCREANARGDLPKNVSIVKLHRTLYPGERNVNATQANGYNTLDAAQIGKAELDLRGQIEQVTAFLRREVPGYARCRIALTPATLGVRESRRVMGDYVLADADVESGARFDDVVVHQAWFVIDIHNPAGSGQAEGKAKMAKPYDIPYRCLLPKGVEGLLTAGRCISGTHRAHSSYRVMGICMATGQAAGTAAAIAAKEKTLPRAVSAKQVQEALKKQGVQLP